MNADALVESLPQESTDWTFYNDGDGPQAWRVNAQGGLDVVGVEAGGYDMAAFADVWPQGVTFEAIPDDSDPPFRKLIATTRSSGVSYDLITQVSELLQQENAQAAWNIVTERGRRDRN